MDNLPTIIICFPKSNKSTYLSYLLYFPVRSKLLPQLWMILIFVYTHFKQLHLPSFNENGPSNCFFDLKQWKSSGLGAYSNLAPAIGCTDQSTTAASWEVQIPEEILVRTIH